MKKIVLLVIVVSAVLCGCKTPERAHYEADRKFLDGAGKEWLKYVDADPALDADSKALRHADYNLFDTEVRRALEGK